MVRKELALCVKTHKVCVDMETVKSARIVDTAVLREVAKIMASTGEKRATKIVERLFWRGLQAEQTNQQLPPQKAAG